MGSSYLEVQVAMVMLAVGMAGLYSMTVVQTRQANRLRDSLPPADVAALNQAPTVWQRKLGVYATIDDAVVPADPVLPRTDGETIVDNQDGAPGFTFYQEPSDPNSWISWTHSYTYNGNAHYHRSTDLVGSWCQFESNGLLPGNYEVLVTHPSFSSLGDAVPYEIYDGTTLLGTVNVDQTQSTSGTSYGGRMFDSLGVYTIDSGQLRVRLTDGPGCSNYILADAILISSQRVLDVVSITRDANGGATAVLEKVP
ncbi:hypothetical protein [Planctomycetes bacterium K23_9]|uniref:Golvesin/Xly CBD-like domain-containing protein n=1 Tax=Stieleria marina TaxID=1930275 RepID=A0A517P1S6_9BACT|nr:hypothetical protein K239x_53390 [Planctomycetes bacterium K23_9]